MNGRNIVTSHIVPPIPIRSFDWCAHYDDYDVDGDSEGWYSADPVGYGATEQEAIDNLLDQAD